MDVSAILLATGLFAWLERRRLRDYGLPLRGAFGLRFWSGGVLGFGGIAFFIGTLAVTGHATLGPELLHGAAAIRYAWLWGIAFLLISVGEELLMRGYMLATLTRGIGFWPSAVLTSLFFAFVHLGNPGETAFGLFQVFVFGMIAALMLRRTGSLWLPIGYHAFWDWGQSYFFGVADSGLLVGGTLFRTKIAGPVLLTGGSAGPEGSVLTFLILVATGWLVIAVWKPALPVAETKPEAVVLRPDEGADPCHDEISSS
jgi:membrane protease YdiL (CAAX protease family)